MPAVRVFLSLVLFTLFSTIASANKFTLVPQTTIETPTLVTLGIPLPSGLVDNLAYFKINDEQGNDVPIFIEPTLYWHFNPDNAQSIRAVRVQFFVEQLSEANDDFSWFIGSTAAENRIEKSDISLGLMVNENASKAQMAHPKIIAVHQPKYLESAGLVAPFYRMREDAQKDYWRAQYYWASQLDYANSTLANWLFDRVTALYKGCMRTGVASCYVEAYSSFNYWMENLKRDGDWSDCMGGSLLAGPIKACDTKYTYIEPLKIHLALTGDDSQFDHAFVSALAELSDKQHYYQAKYDDAYDAEEEPFTERGAGISLNAMVNAYEITGDETLLTNINTRINVLHQHILKENPDGLPLDGTWRHSWARHEGGDYPGDNSQDDRRFSPWMTENITDALWQAYQVTKNPIIEEMLVASAMGLLNHGFVDSPTYKNDLGHSLSEQTGKYWVHSCNSTKTSLLYSGSSTAGNEAIIKTQSNDGWYTDSHNPEAILSLALGALFTDNVNDRELLINKIQSIESGYLNDICGSISSTKRKFNWNNRSNYWGTYLWVMNELNQLPAIDSSADEQAEALNADSQKKSYNKNFIDLFDDGISTLWSLANGWEVAEGQLQPTGQGLIYTDETLAIGEQYKVSAKLNPTDDTTSLNAALLFNGERDGSFYTARVKLGQWGAFLIYHHEAPWDIGGRLVATSSTAVSIKAGDELFVEVHGSQASVGLNDVEYLTHEIVPVSGNAVAGLMAFSRNNTYGISKVAISYKPQIVIVDDFVSKEEFWQENEYWHAQNGILASAKDSHYLLSLQESSAHYEVAATILKETTAAKPLGIIVGSTPVNEHYFSIRISTDTNGGVALFEHSDANPAGTLIYQHAMVLDGLSAFDVRCLVKGNVVNVTLDDIVEVSFVLNDELTNQKVGFVNTQELEAKASSFSYRNFD